MKLAHVIVVASKSKSLKAAGQAARLETQGIVDVGLDSKGSL